MSQKNKPSFLLLGEAVIDLISGGVVDSLEDADSYHRFAGGQVSNLAINLSRLGYPVKLGACIGDDGFGRFITDRLSEAGIDLNCLQITQDAPTTLIPVARQTGTPDFSVYRGADAKLSLTDQLLSAVTKVQVVHTSAFGLSRDPCRSTIHELLKLAKRDNVLISLDPNYHPSIWPDHSNFKDFLKSIFGLVTVTKPSLEDSFRFFGPGLRPEIYLEKYLELGTEIVALTAGNRGAYIGTKKGDRLQIVANNVKVVDVTGAGDAFWSGLLIGLLDGLAPAEAARLGQAVAEYKIGILGPIRQFLSLAEFKSRAEQVKVELIT